MTSNMENYRKIQVVGKGSFGCAVLVQSVLDRKYYIMKIIDVSKMDRKQKEEALNEVTLLKNMRHPYIVTYRESFMDRNRFLCIVMDYADGGDMYKKIAEQRKLGKGFSQKIMMFHNPNENQVLDWFVQISLAMKYVHDRKILHRDLKTQNIFLTSKGDIKIGDFGIARVLEDTQDCAQTAIGTPYYLSPEICQEKPYNQKSDIWSLGCILYELVTLRHAFDASNMKGLVYKIIKGQYPTIPPNYSNELKDLIAEMLNKDPAKRPSMKKILEKDFLASRIGALVSNTIIKHELGNTLLKKVDSASTPIVNRELLADKSNIINQKDSEYRKSSKERDSNSFLKALDDEKKSVNNSVNQSILPVNHSINQGAKESILTRKSLANYQTNEAVVKPPEEKRSSSITRGFDEEPRKSEPLKILKRANEEEQKQQPSFLKFSEKNPYKENRPSTAQSRGAAKETEEEMKVLLNEVAKLQKNDKSNDSGDEFFEEEPNKRFQPKFLALDGKEIQGCSETDPMGYRIESLKVYLEKQINADPFYEAYSLIRQAKVDEDPSPALSKIMGDKKIKFVPLIYQLIVCEDTYYDSN